MAEKDFYKLLAERGRKGKRVTDDQRHAVEELQEINDKIDDYISEKRKVEAHLHWLTVKLNELERQKESILSRFDGKDI